MKLGIFLNQDHSNFFEYLSFLTAHTVERTDVHIHAYNSITAINDLPSYDKNIYLNRYAYINFDSIVACDNKTYIASINPIIDPFIVIASKSKLKQSKIKKSVSNFLYDFYDSKYESLKSKSFMQNLGYIGTTINKAWFICFDDLSKSFIDSLNDLERGKKQIFYNNKIYNIDIYKDFFIYKNTNACRIENKKYVYWESLSKKWKSLNLKKGNILC